MKELLEQIAAGKRSFKPENGDHGSFQPIAHKLQESYALGYISSHVSHHESYTGNHYIVLVIAGNLTEAGRRFLES